GWEVQRATESLDPTEYCHFPQMGYDACGIRHNAAAVDLPHPHTQYWGSRVRSVRPARDASILRGDRERGPCMSSVIRFLVGFAICSVAGWGYAQSSSP